MTQDEFRQQFPLLTDGLVYLDNAAKTLTPTRVIEALLRYHASSDAALDRSVHRLGRRAAELAEQAREQVAALIDAPAEEIVFVRGTTEALNLVAEGLPWQRGDRVVTSLVEHHANFLPWLRLAEERGVEVDVVRPATIEGRLDPAEIEAAVRRGPTRLVAIGQVSNVLGTVQPVAEIAARAKRAGAALVLVDGAQGVPHLPLRVDEWPDVDLLAWSGHKMFGPTGTGVLWGRRAVLSGLRPLLVGGGAIREVTGRSYLLDRQPPWRALEAGTADIAGRIGLGEAAALLAELHQAEALAGPGGGPGAQVARLTDRILTGLAALPGVTVFGPAPGIERCGILSFTVAGWSPHQVAALLDAQHGIAVRSGHHCAQPLVRELLGLPDGTVRASLNWANNDDDGRRLVEAVAELADDGGDTPAGVPGASRWR